MKLVALCAWGLALSLAGCSISHRSGDFACQKQSDCSSGRNCVDGFCVATQVDSGVPDAAPDAPGCPSQCTSCSTDAKTCTVDCRLNGGCKQQVTCPTGWACTIQCTGEGACASGIDCLNSTSCKINCTGRSSCHNLSCGLGPCSVDCSGQNSCVGVSCGQSCACGVNCGPFATCDTVSCRPSPQQCTLIRGCTATATGCNTCP